MGKFDKFLEIRKVYAGVIPELMADFERNGNMQSDPYFMDWDFTPIESAVWQDIRGMGIPFYPQLPALNYFLDFGNPMLKIGIEADGKAWHDMTRDAARDARLIADAWTIFRIEGHECNRWIDIEYERRMAREYEIDFNPQRLIKFYMETSEGVMRAIKYHYFDNMYPPGEEGLIESTLRKHRSRPDLIAARYTLKPAQQAAAVRGGI
jgi:very-short-patch-repair endonuclease